MTFIATAIFKVTFGLLIDETRDSTAEKLKEGDVTNGKFRSLIVRQIEQIDSKLDTLARQN